MGTKYTFLFTFLIVQVLCEQKNSLTFIIDDTGSMYDEIYQVKSAAKSIIDIVLNEKSSQIEDIVVVTFNDPSVAFRHRTRDEVELKKTLDGISINNGGDCPEMALSGVKVGLEESQPGSYLFVFSDASAKDYNKFDEIKALCQEKQSQIIFVLTGDCGSMSTDDSHVYYKIAAASNGQVFRISKGEVGQVLEYVKETIKGDKTVITSILVPAYKWTAVHFNIDDKTEYALVSASGTNVELRVQDQFSNNLKGLEVIWMKNVKSLKLIGLRPGAYKALVYGSSDVNVMIFGRTDFNFKFGFSNKVENSLLYTEAQPTEGTKTHLIISVKDDEHSVNINNVEILDMNERVIQLLPLTDKGGNVYATNKFLPPNSMFKIAVTATARSTGKPIRRIAKTPVEPIKPVVVAPEISDTEKILKAKEGETVNIHCRIRQGKPKPHVSWYFKQRGAKEFELIQGKTEDVLRKSNVAVSDTGEYRCVAANIAGQVSHIVQLEVFAPPRIVFTPPNSPFYEGVEGDVVMRLPCPTVGYPKPTVSWKVDQVVVEKDKSRTLYVEDGVLYLKNPKESDSSNYPHTYVCHAVNELGEARQSYEVIMSKFADYTYNEREKKYGEIKKPYDLNCPLLYTDPNSVRWFKNSIDMNKYGPSLHFDDPTQADNCNYTCRVSDLNGAASHTVELLFGIPPSASRLVHDEQWNGDEDEITCKAEHIPDGKYEWFYHGEKIKEVDDAQELELSLIGWGQYVCRVTTPLGSLNITYNVHAEDCVIERSLSRTKNLPLVLDMSSAWPTFSRQSQYQIIATSKKLTLICQDESPKSRSNSQSGSNTFIKFPNTKSITATCDHEDLFLVDGVSHKFSELDCKEEVSSSVVPTRECLGSETMMMDVGFYVNGFLDVYKSCLDTKRNVVLYTEVITTGADSFGYTNEPERACESIADCCYESVQLVNAADVGAGPAEKATLREPLNTVSYCRPNDEDTMNWHNIEKQVRRESSTSRMIVWSGAVKYTSVANKLLVPQYLWKVVKDLETEEIVAIVHSNEQAPSASVCENVCHESSWFESYGPRTYCCRLDEFKKVFNITIKF